MRITRFLDEQDRPRCGVDLGDGQADVFAHDDPLGPLEPTGRRVVIHRRLAPIQPVNVFCIGINYVEHAAETGKDVPEHPVVFMKPTSAVTDPGSPIVLPASAAADEVDYEVELAVVIGTPGRDIPEADALDHVLGYTVANDVSARKWQKHGGGGQWIRGKSFDTFCPLGPVLVTPGSGPDELGDPQALSLRTTVNGKTLQDGTTADMIHSVAKAHRLPQPGYDAPPRHADPHRHAARRRRGPRPPRLARARRRGERHHRRHRHADQPRARAAHAVSVSAPLHGSRRSWHGENPGRGGCLWSAHGRPSASNSGNAWAKSSPQPRQLAHHRGQPGVQGQALLAGPKPKPPVHPLQRPPQPGDRPVLPQPLLLDHPPKRHAGGRRGDRLGGRELPMDPLDKRIQREIGVPLERV